MFEIIGIVVAVAAFVVASHVRQLRAERRLAESNREHGLVRRY
jgi:hypothetical protein